LSDTGRRKCEYSETLGLHQLFVDLKKPNDSVRMEVFYNILTEYSVTMKLDKFIQMCLNETYSKIILGKHLSDMFSIQNGLKQGGLSP
jgi:hypothetical protein